MKYYLYLFTLFFCSCSSGRIDQLERDLKSQIADIRSQQAQQSTAINEIRTQLRTISGSIEEIQHISIGKTQELEASISKLKSRVPPPAGVPEDLLNQDDDKIASIKGEAADLYRNALSALRTGDFELARTSLNQFVEGNSGTAFTDNALFWLGISYDKLGQNDRAILSYSEVFQKYPAEDMVSPSLYFLAEDFLRIDSKADAIVTLQKLIDEHPASSYALKAEEKLAELQPKSKSKTKKPQRK